jgi:hypothetical protein
MKIAYTDALSLSKANKIRLSTINGIIETYVADGYIMTLRQLYYQLVARDIIANNAREYAKLSILLKKGRMAGVVDWDAIEDRGRLPKLPWHTYGVSAAIQTIHDQYRLDRQEGQENYIEVWVEKDALSNVMLRVTEKYHVRLMVNKGYSSCSAMKQAADRFEDAHTHGVLIYLGDHDPSGKDMVRDIEARLNEFGVDDLEVISPALTMEQIRRYRLPENPAKITDPRAKQYIEMYGNKSWELDALEPPVLVKIVEDAILDYLDLEAFDEMKDKEKMDKKKLYQIIIDNHDQ